MNTDFAAIGLDMPYRVIISEDPIWFKGGDVNFYTYVKNMPLRFIDPYGYNPIWRIPPWIIEQTCKQIGKWLGKNVGKPDTDVPEEGDDDGDGLPNFEDPDSEYCKINCDKPKENFKKRKYTLVI